MTKTSTQVVRLLRLTPLASKLLRQDISRRGDISLRANRALLETDLKNIKAVPKDKAPGSGRGVFEATTICFESHVYDMVIDIAHARGISINVLINAAITHFFKPRAAGENHVESDNSRRHQSERWRRKNN